MGLAAAVATGPGAFTVFRSLSVEAGVNLSIQKHGRARFEVSN